MDVTDKGFIEAVHKAGLVIPKSDHTLWLLPKYEEKLNNIWKEYKKVEQISITYQGVTREMMIPLSVKGSLWHWVCSKPVANKNPYNTLFEEIKKQCFPELDRDSITMYLPTESSPENFNKQTTYNNDWVKEGEHLLNTEIVIQEGREEIVHVTSRRDLFMERIRVGKLK